MILSPVLALPVMVGAVLLASRRPSLARLFDRLPLPLWCYGLPMLLRAAGLLPAQHPAYAWLTERLLPIALAVLLMGVDWLSLVRVGRQALVAVAAGALGVMLGGPLMVWLFRSQLPAESWKGVGALAGTWTGGSLNMVALQTILNVPDRVFAPLLVVDALVTYSWMSVLIAAKGVEPQLNRWLGAGPVFSQEPTDGATATERGAPRRWTARIVATLLALGLTAFAAAAARALPLTGPVTTTNGWAVLLVSTLALALAGLPAIRRLSLDAAPVGYACLYLVLAGLGSRASLAALAATPAWIVVAVGWLVIHAAVLLVVGRLLRIPAGLLATASQANIGGVVSAPMVGAIYHRALAPVGLLLAIGCNALGTYLGLASASLAHWLISHS
ncbi:MAG: DUF819 family protein [Candidatus Omnitrophica bacterium]|nr:DUF819 family protein [Candidatus Omnitrophota bacterium]